MNIGAKTACFILVIFLILQIFPPLITSTKHAGISEPKLNILDENQLMIQIARVRPFQADPFYIVIGTNEREDKSDLFQGNDVFPNWTVTKEISDSSSQIVISIQIRDRWDRNMGYTEIDCNTQTGDWTGGDFRGDDDGYGHILRDNYEIWFDLHVNDMDGDRLTYWEEINVYHTDPTVNDAGHDFDEDGTPIEWEDKWGYNPFVKEDHNHLDLDADGLTNVQEWETSQWLSDPFRQDIFIELDWMDGKHVWERSYRMPEESIQQVITAFTKENIMLMVDDGWMGGGEEIPFYNQSQLDLRSIYWRYFLNQFQNVWRRGIFHYLICLGVNPWAQEVAGFNFQADGFVVCMGTIRLYRFREADRVTSAAGIFMHELGHNLGLFSSDFGGIDNPDARFPWQDGFWTYGPYRSCMNYRYTWNFVGYSHGTHDAYDFDDWGNLNLKHFLDS